MRILLLEDTYMFAEGIIKNLEFIGYEVVWKATPEEALEEMRSENPPDLCMFDMRIEGNRRLGSDVAAQIKREINRPVPIIIYTSYGSESEFTLRAQAAGIPLDFFVDRNVIDDPDRLQNLIEKAAAYYGPPNADLNNALFQSFRKIGVCTQSEAPRTYKFFGKDEIMFLESSDVYKTTLHTKNEQIVIATNIGNVGKQIQKNFPNIVKISQSFWINLEQIKSREGDTLYFSNNSHIPLGREMGAKLRQYFVLITVN